MTRYYAVSDSNGSKGKFVAELNRTQLTRLFKGAYRIYKRRTLFSACDTVRFVIAPPNGEILLRIDFSDRRCLEIPLKVVSQGGVPTWLQGDIPNEGELAVFVLPPGRMNSGRSCARIWLAFYKSCSDAERPNQYSYEQKVPVEGEPITPCPAVDLPSLEICTAATAPQERRQDDEAEGYHED